MGLIKQALSRDSEEEKVTEEQLLKELEYCENSFKHRKAEMLDRVAEMWQDLYMERERAINDIYFKAVDAGYGDKDGNWPTEEARE